MTRMDEAAKRRLVGAAVLVALAVIFVPMLVEQGDDGLGEPIVIPEAPDMDGAVDGDADTASATSGLDQSLPEPDDLLLPLPTPAPPPSSSGADPAVAEPRSASPSETTASTVERRSNEPRSSTTRGDPDRGETAARAPAGPKPLPPGTRAWVIQVASLGSPEAARGMQDELRKKGYPAFVEQADVGGRRYYRVRVGPETERGRADRLAKQLAADTGGQPLVQRYP
jgi:DedD protein